jgi:hypothetical protein
MIARFTILILFFSYVPAIGIAKTIYLVRLQGAERESVARIMDQVDDKLRLEIFSGSEKIIIDIHADQLDSKREMDSPGIRVFIKECENILEASVFGMLIENLSLLDTCRGIIDLSVWKEQIDGIRTTALERIISDYKEKMRDAGDYERNILNMVLVDRLKAIAMTGLYMGDVSFELKTAVEKIVAEMKSQINSEEYLDLFASINPSSKDALEYATLCIEQEKYGYALAVLRRYVETDKSQAQAWSQIAFCQLRMGDWAAAISTVQGMATRNYIGESMAINVLEEFIELRHWPYGVDILPSDLFHIIKKFKPNADISILYILRINYRRKDGEAHYLLAKEHETNRNLMGAILEYEISASLEEGPRDSKRRANSLRRFHKLDTLVQSVRSRRDYYAEIVGKSQLADYTINEYYYNYSIDDFETYSYQPIEYYREARNAFKAKTLSKILYENPNIPMRSDLNDKQLARIDSYYDNLLVVIRAVR